ncbi:hypothetical protein SAMN05421666_1597 [Roseovarius nanhaiticus]|uniref:Hemolysin-type calcium-binding repeat-containing protein n=1 Tax=Roseovarius nanhaiticus TaxID=573024 RepID=A0A1N7G2J6_9RHOB|nr:hypothetical protein [Roseovarius nanhaiticus]SEK39214.1 hypothetical protein SAMN05216208_0539 [Roseovarius nanhaiticus]SIS06656.1 hypothetical protein SAMN05421666_1597 [Roseovarius nanhaiticus]
MGPLIVVALLSGLIFGTDLLEDDDPPLAEADPDDTGENGGEEPELDDTGATFERTDDGVTLSIGEDETGSLAVIYYTDTEDNVANFVEVDEARFYLVPEGTDWSDASWETRGNVPGSAEFGGPASEYELDEFEEAFDLQLLGVVDLLGTPENTEDPGSRVGEITANQPVAGFFLEATTDGDELVSFLPEDFVVTRNGVPQTPVDTDTIGTDDIEWLSAEVDGITLNGAGGDDILETARDDVTLLGGAGNDTLESSGANTIIDGGAGDDVVTARGATVTGGEGDDRITITSGAATGGAGDDRLVSFGMGTSLLQGGAGADSLSVSGAGSEAFGGSGNDFIGTSNGAAGFGGAGDDRMQVDSGTRADGGAGNDVFTVWNQFRDPDGPATVTTGDGADTINALVRNAARGEADDIYLRVTDFDPAEDLLEVGSFQTGNRVDDVEINEAADGSHTDIRVSYTALSGLPPGIAVIRLEGTTGVSAANIAIV